MFVFNLCKQMFIFYDYLFTIFREVAIQYVQDKYYVFQWSMA